MIILNSVEDIPPVNKKCTVYIPIESINFEEIILKLIELNYCLPKIIKNEKLFLVLTNTTSSKLSRISNLNHVNYTLEQFNNGNACVMEIQISKNTIDFLRNLPISHRKEHSGSLHTESIYKLKNPERYIHILTFTEDSIQEGESQNVTVSKSKFNFHSHPKEAYLAHHVTKGWPSLTDYLGYYKLGNYTIFHCVTTLEGIYIISFKSKKNNNQEKFIESNYDIVKTTNLTPEEYCSNVNALKNGIFKVDFATWKDLYNKIFKIKYLKNGLNCLTFD